MSKRIKKFIVFTDDWSIYLYGPETDDMLIKSKRCELFDTLKAAQEKARQNLKNFYDERLASIDGLKYNDFSY